MIEIDWLNNLNLSKLLRQFAKLLPPFWAKSKVVIIIFQKKNKALKGMLLYKRAEWE